VIECAIYNMEEEEAEDVHCIAYKAGNLRVMNTPLQSLSLLYNAG
jgi:hypothetical protein